MKIILNRTFDVFLALLCELVGLLSMPIVPLACALACLKRDSVPTQGSWGTGTNVADVGPFVHRADLPMFFAWLGTPDERLPGGLYEPDVREWFAGWGFWACSVLWLWRNRAYQFGYWLGRPADEYLQAVPGRVATMPGIWRWQKDFGPVRIGTGWKCMRQTVGIAEVRDPLVAVPFISIRKKPR
jgi:hypothetical protein